MALGQLRELGRQHPKTDKRFAALFEWHMAEEVEHRNVAYDIYQHLYGDYLYRAKMCLIAQSHILKFITVTPMKGMAPGTAFILDEGGGDEVIVHVCPESYASSRETGLRRGDWVKVKGVWADIGDESVFLAAKIRKDNEYAFKVRLTSDGTPFWTLTPELLAQEKAAVE